MRLTALDPKWVVAEDGRHGQGVRFTCPVHGGHCRIVTAFANPLDGGPPMRASYAWQRTGDTFETLTLSPSVHILDVSRWDKNNPDDRSKWKATTHWHGWISGGEVT